MPKPTDRVQIIKQEDPTRGGGSDPDDWSDFLNEPLNPDEDAPEVGGLFFQQSGIRDSNVVIYREDGKMWFEDTQHAAGSRVNLDDLTAGGASGLTTLQHKRLRHGIHFLDDGPAEGFASGAVKVTEHSGAFPTSETWYESSAETQKIVEKVITYTGAFEDTVTWRIYDEDGSTVLATIVDVIERNGVFEETRTRTIT